MILGWDNFSNKLKGSLQTCDLSSLNSLPRLLGGELYDPRQQQSHNSDFTDNSVVCTQEFPSALFGTTMYLFHPPFPCSTSFSIASELGTMAWHIHSDYANFIESILKLVHLIVNWMLLHSSPYIYTMGSKCFIEFQEILWKTFISRKHLLFFWVYNSV